MLTTGCYNRDLRNQIRCPLGKCPWTVFVFVAHLLHLSVDTNVFIATLADYMIILAIHKDSIAFKYFQENFNFIENCLKFWWIKVNENKLVHDICHNLFCCLTEWNSDSTKDVKDLGMHLDRQLNWKKQICTKHKHLRLKISRMYCLLDRNSQLSLKNKVLLYTTISKSIWTWGIQL